MAKETLNKIRSHIDNPQYTEKQALNAIIVELKRYLVDERKANVYSIRVNRDDFIAACKVMTEPVVMLIGDSHAILLSDDLDRFLLTSANIKWSEGDARV